MEIVLSFIGSGALIIGLSLWRIANVVEEWWEQHR